MIFGFVRQNVHLESDMICIFYTMNTEIITFCFAWERDFILHMQVKDYIIKISF